MPHRTVYREYEEVNFKYEDNRDYRDRERSPLSSDELRIVCAKAREEIIDMIIKTGSGHPGGSLSVVELLAVLLNRNPNAKIILSKGHGGPALYALGKIMRFLEDEITLRKPFSKFQGHPEKNHPLVRFNTGPLSTGLAFSIGLAKAYLDENPEDPENVYVIVGDGELQEGLVYEALSMAAQMKLKNLYVIVDNNKHQIDGACKEINDSVKRLERAFKKEFLTARIGNGHSIEEIDAILDRIETIKEPGIGRNNQPKFIIANTVKGKGISFMEDTHEWHGKAPKDKEGEKARKETKFDERLPLIDHKIHTINKLKNAIILPEREIYTGFNGPIAPRTSHGKRIRQIIEANPGKVYCTVPDLTGSVGYSGIPNDILINTGVAEAISIGIAGGLAAAGKLVFNAGFTRFNLTFGSCTLSANDYNNLPVIYAFTHKGIATGGDGPSHQTLYADHIATAFPNMKVLIPADANQVTAMIDWAVGANIPVCILMGRNKLDILMKPYKLTLKDLEEEERMKKENYVTAVGRKGLGIKIPLYGKDYEYMPGLPDLVYAHKFYYRKHHQSDRTRTNSTKIENGITITFFSNGETLHEIIKAADRFSWYNINGSRLNVFVYNVHDLTDTCIDERLYATLINSDLIFTIEDQNVGTKNHRRNSGVLKCIINDLIVETCAKGIAFHIGVKENYGTSGTKEELYDIFGLSAKRIEKLIKDLITLMTTKTGTAGKTANLRESRELLHKFFQKWIMKTNNG